MAEIHRLSRPARRKSTLTVVRPEPVAKMESAAQAARRLHSEALAEAGLAVQGALSQIARLQAEAEELSTLEAVAGGIRERSRILAEHLRREHLSITSLVERRR